jgi:DNA-binding transcriptional LysR family regulator
MTANISRGFIPLRAFSRAPAVAAPRAKPVVRTPLKTHQLVLLVQLDEERRLARAAEIVGLTQPAASKLLRQIETTLGVQLFERHARGLAPTCYGEILIRHARQALSELRLAQEEVAALRAGRSGKAAVGTITDPGTNLVPYAIARVKERYPHTIVQVEIEPSRLLVSRLLEGRLDLVVARLLDAETAGELSYEPLAADEPHAVIASAAHPLAGRHDVGLEDLVGHPWILPPHGSLVREKLIAMFLQEGLPQPGNIVEATSLPVITTLLARSNMVVALPESAVRSHCNDGVLTALMRNLPLRVGGFGIITRRSAQLPPAARLLLETMREMAAALYADQAAC